MAEVKKRLATVEQISAGGVAVRLNGDGTHRVALIRTSTEGRWQLPKGIIDAGETPEVAALREVREEAGIDCRLLEKLDTIEYWFYAAYDGERKRYHKFVHFFLMEYLAGNVSDHDHEVEEARWVDVDDAVGMLAFDDERRVMKAAAERFGSRRE